MREHSFKFFSLTLLGIKILSAHIMQDSIFWLFFTTGYPVKYINVVENQLSSWEKSYVLHPICFWVAMPYFPVFLTCPITWYPGLDWWIFFRADGSVWQVKVNYCVPVCSWTCKFWTFCLIKIINLLSKMNNSGKKCFFSLKLCFLFS